MSLIAFALLVALAQLPGCSAGGFRPTRSSSFVGTDQSVQLDFMDGSSLSAQVASDVVQIGSLSQKISFASVSSSKGSWSNAEGIIGLGLPQQEFSDLLPVLHSLFPMNHPATKTGSAMASVAAGGGGGCNPSALSASSAGAPAAACPLSPPPVSTNKDLEDPDPAVPLVNVFAIQTCSLYPSEEPPALQIGGFIPPKDFSPVSFYPNVLFSQERSVTYALPVQSIRLGDYEILGLKTSLPFYPGIIDSATSCIVLPDPPGASAIADGPFKYSPYEKFVSVMSKLMRIPNSFPSLSLRIHGKDYAIPFSQFVEPNGDVCVMRLPRARDALVLGEPFFRSFFVVHDNRDPQIPRIGLASPNPPSLVFLSTARGASMPSTAGVAESGRYSDGGYNRLSMALMQASKLKFREESQLFVAPFRSWERLSGNWTWPQTAVSALDAAVSDHSSSASLSFPAMSVRTVPPFPPASQVIRLPLQANRDRTFTVEVAVGSPSGQKLRVLVDTGSSVMAVFLETSTSSAVLFMLLFPVVVVLIVFVHFVIGTLRRKRFSAGSFRPLT